MTRQTGGDGGGVDRRQALKTAAAGGAALALGAGAFSSASAAGRVSALGVYQGYSTEAYDGWVRTAVYVPVRDGVRLAVDIYRPTKGGVLHKGRLPVVWQPKRYQRAIGQPDGAIRTVMGARPDDVFAYAYATAQNLVRHGYIIASVDRRGSGASFGTRSEAADPIDAPDGYDITEWLAKQPWSDGKIGMFGASYEGEMQLRVASTAPPHLKAIMPEVSPVDWYRVVSPGGCNKSWSFGGSLLSQDTNQNNGAVDADKDRSLLNAALAQHKAGNDYAALEDKLPFRDSKNPRTGEQDWLKRHAGVYAPGLTASGVAVYHRVGWFAFVMQDQLIWYASQKSGPKKMLVGPWATGSVVTAEERAQWATEAHRWFDYWLKGVPNGIMDEPPIYSSVPSSHTRTGTPWRGLSQWPLPNEQRTQFFFGAGKSGTSASVNDGRLVRARPADDGRDDYTVKYDCSYKGIDEPARGANRPIDHSDFDAQGLTYTTDPLDAEMEVTGHGEARLWITSTAPDGDFYLKLQDVSPDGASTYVSSGLLRASRRAVGKPLYEFFGLPFNTCYESDARNLVPGEATELVFALMPCSYIFQRGHRIRVTITCSDLQWGNPQIFSPTPLVSLHRASAHASSVTLPIIPTA